MGLTDIDSDGDFSDTDTDHDRTSDNDYDTPAESDALVTVDEVSGYEDEEEAHRGTVEVTET